MSANGCTCVNPDPDFHGINCVPQAFHLWNGDDLGHNCRDCSADSVWRCDPAQHMKPPVAAL